VNSVNLVNIGLVHKDSELSEHSAQNSALSERTALNSQRCRCNSELSENSKQNRALSEHSGLNSEPSFHQNCTNIQSTILFRVHDST
jgi:hypothetical protein